jgi:hypothetical protein
VQIGSTPNSSRWVPMKRVISAGEGRAPAKNAEAACTMSLARRSSRTCRSSSVIRCWLAVVMPGRRPPSTSAWRTQPRSDALPMPSWRATRVITPKRSPVCSIVSSTTRTARSRSSGG